jgi:hypothetical protein
MARASDPIDRSARSLAQFEHGPLIIKNCRSELNAPAAMFDGADYEAMGPATITLRNCGKSSAYLPSSAGHGPEQVAALAGQAGTS